MGWEQLATIQRTDPAQRQCAMCGQSPRGTSARTDCSRVRIAWPFVSSPRSKQPHGPSKTTAWGHTMIPVAQVRYKDGFYNCSNAALG